MRLFKHTLKKFIAFLPLQWQRYIYYQYQYIHFLPSLCLLKIRLKILPAIGDSFKQGKSSRKKFNNKLNKEHSPKRKLIFRDLNKSQFLVDSLPYPSTHEYKLNGLKPVGTLKIRLAILNEVAPKFFSGHNFLDIGCNKGFFSLLAAESFDRVQSIDTDERFIKLCRFLKQPNMDIFHTSFRDFAPQLEFDKIFIGNVHHYIFKECRGWEWISKLAAISRGEVLIEGPVDMNCKDMISVIPEDLQLKFTFEKFMQVMESFFSLEQKVPSVSPGRWAMLFRRKVDKFDRRIQLHSLPILRIFKKDKNSIVFLTKIESQRVIAKIYENSVRDLRIRINIARFSPISNDVIGSVYHNERFVGWLEEYMDYSSYNYKENQIKLFKLICDHTIFLAKLGYFDCDCATINFFKNSNKLFDKGSIFPLKIIDENT